MDAGNAKALGSAGYRPAGQAETVRANRHWWDAESRVYLDEHGDFLGDDDFVWGPEGLREEDAGLLGPASGLRGLDILEIGCGAAQCSRWLAKQGARIVGLDLSAGMLRRARDLDDALGASTPVVQADATRLPLRDASVDLACSSYGAVPFVADGGRLMSEVARVLRPGGRWVFSLTHPVRWAFPDDPGEGGLTVRYSYFDRTPYVETGSDGEVSYVEHHRTLGERVAELVEAGFVLERLVEPQWQEGNDSTWGGWSPMRGRLIPGTAIFVCRLA